MTYQYGMSFCPGHQFWIEKVCPHCNTNLGKTPSTQCRLCGCFKGKAVK